MQSLLRVFSLLVMFALSAGIATASPLWLTTADNSTEEAEPAAPEDEPLVDFNRLTNFDLPLAGSVRHQERSAWKPLFQFAYHWQRDFTTNTGTMQGFRGTLTLPVDSPWVIGAEGFLDTGEVDGRNVRRGGIVAFGGFMLESGSGEDQDPVEERDEIFNFKRQRNFHELALGFEWGIVEMKRFVNNDDRTYGGFRAGFRGNVGFYGFNLSAGVAAEVYSDRTLYDSKIFVGFGQPWLPVNVKLGYRNLTVKDYHGSFLVLAIEYRF